MRWGDRQKSSLGCAWNALGKSLGFFLQENGVIALIVSIISPLLVALLVMGFDISNYFRMQTRLNEALREASLGADFISNPNARETYVKNFIATYFQGQNITLDNITQHSNTSQIGTEKEPKTISITNYFASMKMGGWFGKFFDKNNQTMLATNATIEAHKRGDGVGEYLFAMDFSDSMNRGSFSKTSIEDLEFCKPDKPQEYDQYVCSRLKNASNRAEVMQAILIKLIKIINEASKNEAAFAFLPFYAGSQMKKTAEFAYYDGDKLKTTTLKNANYYVLQMTMKPKYRVEDYDFWSGVLGDAHTLVRSRHMQFKIPPYSNHKDHQNALLFFRDFTRQNSANQDLRNLDQYLNNNLPKVVDIDASIDNMFDPNKNFSFHFWQPGFDNGADNGARANGIAYDYFRNTYKTKDASGSRVPDIDGTANEVSRHAARQMQMKFFERDFDKVADPTSLELLNTLPFVVGGRRIDGGGLTLVTTALLRGAAMLTKGKNQKRSLIVITDGVDDETLRPNSDIERELIAMENDFYAHGLCQKIRNGMRARGVDTQLFFVNIANKTESKQTLKRWQSCAGENNAVVVENIDEFLKAIKDFVFGAKFGKFIEK
ncbi:hypothetical protein BJI48_05070 [Helicobacter sp. 11S02596-1]|nr:hypothetical protein BJI48_05070 [Helicobacter sp. 11S02596-1]